MRTATWLAYELSGSALGAATTRSLALIPRQDLRRMGVALGAVFIACPPAALAWLQASGALARLLNPLTVDDVVQSAVAVGISMASFVFGVSCLLKERGRWRRDVTFTGAGVDQCASRGSESQRWNDSYEAFTGVVLSVMALEAPGDGHEFIELRHTNPERSVLLHRSRGLGLHPSVTQLTRSLAASLHRPAYVEVAGELVALED